MATGRKRGIMKDRFKYRVFIKNWKNGKSLMCNVHSLHIGTNKVIVSGNCGNVSVQLNKDNILMQCTGLKDKNGKLIYEGDIVKFTDNITINGLKTHISVVEHNKEYNAYMYHTECMGLYTINPSQNKLFKVEVIGNIYENKDLLKERNNNER